MAESVAMVEDRPRNELLEEEAFLIEHSGEIPEVALYSSIHYLTEDPEGPCLTLSQEELHLLRRAVLDRYLFIILRDVTPRNRDKSIYRGMERAIVNWRRMRAFADRWGYRVDVEKERVREATIAFLRQEISEVRSGLRKSCINCTHAALREFFQELDIGEEGLLTELEEFCCKP